MDSVGIGELPDAAAYGDEGSNTVGNIARRVPLKIPTLRSLGLDRLVTLTPTLTPTPIPTPAAAGRMAEASAGKDSVTGHSEMMGIVLDVPFPVFPNGFPRDVLTEFTARTGRAVLGNRRPTAGATRRARHARRGTARTPASIRASRRWAR